MEIVEANFYLDNGFPHGINQFFSEKAEVS